MWIVLRRGQHRLRLRPPEMNLACGCYSERWQIGEINATGNWRCRIFDFAGETKNVRLTARDLSGHRRSGDADEIRSCTLNGIDRSQRFDGIDEYE
jgi:hypothetical protein